MNFKFHFIRSVLKKSVFILCLALLFSCEQDQGEKKTDESKDVIIRDLTDQLKEKDEIITNYIRSFNEIQDNLTEIKVKEKAIILQSQNPELQKSNKTRIIDDIKYIYTLLNENRKALNIMNGKFNEANTKNKDLEKFVKTLVSRIIKQESEIDSLKHKLNILKNELEQLDVSYTKEKKYFDQKIERTNNVYFAIGTFDGLKNEGLINEKGGVIGLGKTKEINPNVDKKLFSVIDMRETKEISIAANEVKIITLHPTDSYKMEDTKLKIKKLVIKDPNEFWSISKYLIIQVSNDKPLPPKPVAGINS